MKQTVRFAVATILLAITVMVEATSYQCDVPDGMFFGKGNTTSRSFWRPGTRWPDGIVKYELHHSLTANDRHFVQQAFDDIQSKTCIRFQQRSPGEAAYTSIEIDDSTCGWGNYCRTGQKQYAKVGGQCRTKATMVHELGHNLCLGHEHARSDRDEYVEFRDCNGNQIPAKDADFDTRGTLYDYASQMHYYCGWCSGGWPKQEQVTKCGPQVQDGLSVMDADKINALYDCGGCYEHRWRPIESLTTQERNTMVRFGTNHGNGEAIYACRGVINGELCVGKYFASAGGSGVCFLPYGGREHVLTRHAEVFISPSGGSRYRVVNLRDYLDGKVPGRPVRAGYSRDGHVGYIAVATLERGGRSETLVGKAFEGYWNRAWFSFWDEMTVDGDNWKIVVCG